MEQLESIVIGAGQAGLACSYHLQEVGVEHVVLERNQLASSWRRRWDTFRIATPNVFSNLPGYPYEGPDPDGFMSRDELVGFLEGYARIVEPPLRCGVTVHAVDLIPTGFLLSTSDGLFRTKSVIVATGLLQKGRRPDVANGLPGWMYQLHSDDYLNPDGLPPGNVLVVGTGLSGTHIAHDLNRTGRGVYLSVGSNGRTPRRYRGRDIQAWIGAVKLRTLTPGAFSQHAYISDPGPEDLDLLALAGRGVTLLGHVDGVRGNTLLLSRDVTERLARAERFDLDLRRTIDAFIAEQGLDAPQEPEPAPLPHLPIEERGELELRSAGITTVLWATGYRYDYSFVRAPVFDETGWPRQDRGVTDVPGLYFVGMNWLHRPLSAYLPSVGAEAEHVAQHLATT